MNLEQPTRFDVHFSLMGVPVRIHPLFWIVSMLFGLNSAGGHSNFASVAMWTVAVLTSLLVHEMGHALLARHYGWPPRISLYAMGGLAHYTPHHQTRKQEVLIALAGPGAGFLFGGLVLAAMSAVATIGDPDSAGAVQLHLFTRHAGQSRLGVFVQMLLMVNFFWGIMNLLPIKPLDGGTVSAAIIRKVHPDNAQVLTYQVSVGVSVAVAALSLFVLNQVFLGIIFGMLGFNAWQALQALKAGYHLS